MSRFDPFADHVTEDEDEAVYAQGRSPERTYASRSFPVKHPQSAEWFVDTATSEEAPPEPRP